MAKCMLIMAKLWMSMTADLFRHLRIGVRTPMISVRVSGWSYSEFLRDEVQSIEVLESGNGCLLC